MDVATISAMANQSAQIAESPGVILEKWQYILIVIAAGVSGPLTALIVHRMQELRLKIDKRKETGEKVIRLLGNYEIIRLNAYFSYLATDIGSKRTSDQSWLNFQSALNTANVNLREAHGIIKLWMPDNIDKKAHGLILKIDQLLKEGTESWAAKKPPMTFEELPSGAKYEKQYNDLIKRIRDWINKGN